MVVENKLKKVVAINASPRLNWNTDILVQEAAKGAEEAGAAVEKFNLYRLDKFSGCISCFGCKLPKNQGKCVCKDGLTPVLDSIRQADALIIGTPNYLGDVSAACRAFYERLIFQGLTYCKNPAFYPAAKIPVLFIMTSNMPQEDYAKYGYAQTIVRYKTTLDSAIGPTEVFVCGNTLQVKDYSRFNWDIFDPKVKQAQRETQFPLDKAKVFQLGKALITQ
ncbi:MAG: flavodoxin family protein [bacterium]|nr:flavodoxin family protein [bacterium]